MQRRIPAKTLVALLAILLTPPASAFCGFYVAKAGTSLFNRASQVVLVRDGDKTVITMASDFRGAPKDFAVVVPVPTKIERGQIHIGDKKLIDHLDAYSSPRLVEYHDPDPCARPMRYRRDIPMAAPRTKSLSGFKRAERAKALGVTIEASYSVGEYKILILSAKQSSGLTTWLTENGYALPKGAGRVLGSYIKQDMHFFVAKVNLAKQEELGFHYLRPLQVAYETPKFMLPIRLGTVNAQGPQELYIYTLTKKGRVETTNYRTVKLPSGVELPTYLKDPKTFGKFYKAMFAEQVKKRQMRTVFLEYAWNMSWCDPCAAQPLSQDELRQLGVFWLPAPQPTQPSFGGGGPVRRLRRFGGGGAQPVYLTRLHVRYDAAHFPEDLKFEQTGDRSNFQARYVLRWPYKGSENKCAAAGPYYEGVAKREKKEAATLAELTGWKVASIRDRMGLPAQEQKKDEGTWWNRLWK